MVDHLERNYAESSVKYLNFKTRVSIELILNNRSSNAQHKNCLLDFYDYG